MKLYKKDPKLKDQIKQAVLLLRYHKTVVTKKSCKFGTYKQIAEICRITPNYVQHICR